MRQLFDTPRKKLAILAGAFILFIILLILPLVSGGPVKPEDLNRVEFSYFSIGLPVQYETTRPNIKPPTTSFKSKQSGDRIIVHRYIGSSNGVGLESIKKVLAPPTTEANSRSNLYQSTKVGGVDVLLLQSPENEALRKNYFIDKGSYVWRLTFISDKKPKDAELTKFIEAIVLSLEERA